MAIVYEGTIGKKDVKAGNGGDILVNLSTDAEVNLSGGTGKDLIYAAGGDKERIDISQGGEDSVHAVNNR